MEWLDEEYFSSRDVNVSPFLLFWFLIYGAKLFHAEVKSVAADVDNGEEHSFFKRV